MSFETDITSEDNREQYKQLKRDADSINSRLSAWVGTYDSLRAKVDTTKQTELDTKKAQFVQLLKTTMGL